MRGCSSSQSSEDQRTLAYSLWLTSGERGLKSGVVVGGVCDVGDGSSTNFDEFEGYRHENRRVHILGLKDFFDVRVSASIVLLLGCSGCF
jgi:hypothetical protein